MQWTKLRKEKKKKQPLNVMRLRNASGGTDSQTDRTEAGTESLMAVSFTCAHQMCALDLYISAFKLLLLKILFMF